LEYYKKEWKVFEFDENAFPEVKLDKETPKPNVITDEISYYISSLAG